jgi:hypothetical protein
MEKVIECGVRLTKTAIMLEKEQWIELESAVLDRCIAGIRSQRKVFLAIEGFATKSFVDLRVDKGVELYCRIKDFEVVPEQKGLECGIRIKQYVLEMPNETFEAYLAGARETLQISLAEQRNAVLSDTGTKDFVSPIPIKGAEFYCEIKSMCA